MYPSVCECRNGRYLSVDIGGSLLVRAHALQACLKGGGGGLYAPTESLITDVNIQDDNGACLDCWKGPHFVDIDHDLSIYVSTDIYHLQ